MPSQVVSSRRAVVSVTPVIDTAAYGSGDRLGAIQVIDPIGLADSGICVLESISVLDLAAQSAAMDILFFNDLPTVASADNAAISITDAEMAKCIGVYKVLAAGFTALTANSFGSFYNIGLTMKSAANSLLHAVVVSRGTPTYGVANGLTFTYTFSVSDAAKEVIP